MPTIADTTHVARMIRERFNIGDRAAEDFAQSLLAGLELTPSPALTTEFPPSPPERTILYADQLPSTRRFSVQANGNYENGNPRYTVSRGDSQRISGTWPELYELATSLVRTERDRAADILAGRDQSSPVTSGERVDGVAHQSIATSILGVLNGGSTLQISQVIRQEFLRTLLSQSVGFPFMLQSSGLWIATGTRILYAEDRLPILEDDSGYLYYETTVPDGLLVTRQGRELGEWLAGMVDEPPEGFGCRVLGHPRDDGQRVFTMHVSEGELSDMFLQALARRSHLGRVSAAMRRLVGATRGMPSSGVTRFANISHSVGRALNLGSDSTRNARMLSTASPEFCNEILAADHFVQQHSRAGIYANGTEMLLGIRV